MSFGAAVPPAHPAGARAMCRGEAATIVGSGDHERLEGTRGPDVIAGLGGSDTLIGNGGRDVVCGGRGDDLLVGDVSRDVLSGGSGHDTLYGHEGADSLFGGPGDDELTGELGDPDRGDSARGGPGADATTARACDKTVTRSTERAAVTKLVGRDRLAIDHATGAGDVNGDGEVDLLVGSYRAARRAGVVTLVLGPLDGTETVRLHATEDAVRFRGAERDDEASRVAAGDVNGDGFSDVVVGASGSDTQAAEDAGRAYVVFGRRDMEDVDLAAFDEGRQGDAGFQILGSGGGDALEVDFLGDVNGDGLGDVVAGWRFSHTYVVFGKTDNAPVDLRLFDLGLQTGAGYRIATASDGNHFDVAAAGDVDADGHADVVFARSEWEEDSPDPLGTERTEVWIAYGKADTRNVDRAELERTGTRFGWGLTARTARGVGDVNGDGFADVAFLNTPSYAGLRVLMGAADLPREMPVIFDSPLVVDAWFGSSATADGPLAAVGDVDADGLADLAFGSTSTASRPARRNLYETLATPAGSVFALFGHDAPRRPLSAYALGAAGIRLKGPRAEGCGRYCDSENQLSEVSRLGDVNRDGADDLFVFSTHGDRGYVVLSRPRKSRS